MSEIQFEIDGRQVKAVKGMTILGAARNEDIFIPTLCHHEELEPFGGCRLCIVELEVKGWTKLVVSCVYPVEKNIIVRTRSKKIDRIRKTIIELLMAHAPFAPDLMVLAKEYGADGDRYEKDPSFCIHCGLCVRYCDEVTGKNAVGFVDRGINKEISFIPEIAQKECDDCKKCFPLCPTSYLQAAFVLTKALAFAPSQPVLSEPESFKKKVTGE
ncbi:MAG: 2Fe-2S iron-sulfur cluster binding domain-containing protein [Desulfobacteraceae bacterium]|nr:2Fe-2S iron-sulfur cluster binding domain-containing protein [Desulfobacteraceae bacterium]